MGQLNSISHNFTFALSEIEIGLILELAKSFKKIFRALE